MALQHAFIREPNTSMLPGLLTPGTVRVGYFWGLEELVRKLGGDPSSILEKQGLDPTCFDDPDFSLECLEAINLLERCSTVLNEPLFGFHLAAMQQPDVFGCAVTLAQSAPNMRKALQCLVDYIPVSASPECELDMVVLDDVVELRWRTNIGFRENAQTNYHGVLIILKTLKKLVGHPFRASYCTVTCAIKRSDSEAARNFLGCKVHAQAEYNSVAIPKAYLDRPIATANRLSYQILARGLSQLRTASQGDFVEKVRSSVRQALSAGYCTVDRCAELLGTSTRTLQKRLNRTDIKFSDIVRDERIKLAKHALQWSDFSLDEIAFQLGYSEQTSFGRAFKRATGVTPKAFRSERRQNH